MRLIQLMQIHTFILFIYIYEILSFKITVFYILIYLTIYFFSNGNTVFSAAITPVLSIT